MFSEPVTKPDARKPGIFYPEDLADLQALFDEACRMNKAPRGSEEANCIAQRLMWACRAGVTNGDLLRQIATASEIEKGIEPSRAA